MELNKNDGYYVANLSGGKDSLAMVLRIIEEELPLDEVVSFDEGMNFKAVTRNVEKCRAVIEGYGAKLTVLHPDTPFMLQMMAKPVRKGDQVDHYGYDWCGGRCRWMTAEKIRVIDRHLSQLRGVVQYVGIAADEAERVKPDGSRLYPLAEWGMTESDCLAYCRSKGFSWDENGTDLYDVLDRASCWCCANKNLKELRNIRRHLPDYWQMLLGLQSRIDRPFRSDGSTVFDLEERFALEDAQMSLLDMLDTAA